MVNVKLTEPQIKWLINILDNEIQLDKADDQTINYIIVKKLENAKLGIQHRRKHA